MILYFADRQMEIIGQASTALPKGLTVTTDKKSEDIETGVAVFECKIGYSTETRALAEKCANVGNYVLRSHNGENEFYTIIDTEFDTKKQTAYIYAEDAGLDLLNEVVGEYEADKAYPISYYIEKFAYDSGFEIGINEIPKLTRKLSWDSESTVTARLASAATQFDGCEISYSFEVKGLIVTKKYINIHKKRGQDTGVTLRLNEDIDSIITSKSIANLATGLLVTGGTPEGKDNPITLSGYSYDDGNFYVSGKYLYSREALKLWSRYIWNKEPGQISGGKGHIVKLYQYDTTSQSTLCAHAVTELKKACQIEVNYDVDIKKLPDNVKIGDTVNIVDKEGELYLSTRILALESSAVDDTYKATLGEYLLKTSGISQKVADLAEQFSKTSASAARALSIANAANGLAVEAKAQADNAAESVENAAAIATEAKTSAENALQYATEAQAKADSAQSAVETVEENVLGLETTVSNAQQAADNAQAAAVTAQGKADEAAQSAETALTEAANAKTAAESAESKADSAISQAETAQSTASTAKTSAEEAQETAAAAKLDAETAQNEIDALGESLKTLENKMTADYARKTDLTETSANLQTQIKQNAALIASNASSIVTIDETANNAAEQAQAAQQAADQAQAQADTATAEATAAQTAADEAKTAATNAQTEADKAKAAAATAQSVADKAEADLAAAQADLATVQGRVDATESEIAAAQAAVNAAQQAAGKAQEEADEAAEKAVEAQTAANTAATNAAAAQSTAADALSKAAIAQATADEAKGDASAAQAVANEAKANAATAQQTANTAATNAAAAQAAANDAAATAANAQQAANEADEKAAQAQSDLETAKQNLIAVTSRVDATEEEVAAAQAAVETAQAAANKAQAEAETAQSTANTAAINAANAQSAANNAKTAADKAQEEAEAAKAAADKAQADVEALEVRVESAETSIIQNSEKIELRATKTEVTQAVNKIGVGGRNLIKISQITAIGFNFAAKTTNNIELSGVAEYNGAQMLFGGEYPAGEYTINATGSNSGKAFRLLANYNIDGHFSYNEYYEANGYPYYKDITTPATFTFTEATNIGFVMLSDNGDQIITDLKLEKGNKATDWLPAPEDIANDISIVEDVASKTAFDISQSQSAIEQLANSISTLVTDNNGVSLMKQTANGWTFSTAEIQSTIEDTATQLGKVAEDLGSTESVVNALKSAVNDIGLKTEYINIATYTYTDQDGNEQTEPCIELGESDSDYKLLITNTQILFKIGTNTPTRIDIDGLVSENVTVENELRITNDAINGSYIWSVDSSGYISLQWKGADS